MRILAFEEPDHSLADHATETPLPRCGVLLEQVDDFFFEHEASRRALAQESDWWQGVSSCGASIGIALFKVNA